jgi:hypothetical protein
VAEGRSSEADQREPVSTGTGKVRPGRIGSTLGVVALFVAFFSTALVRADEAATPPPDGWWIYKTGAPSEADSLCANNAMTSRFAALSNGSVILSSGGEYHPTFPDTPFAGGRLEGEDMGEFGGALRWVAPDGFTRLQILDENARGLLRTPYGDFILTGVDHGSHSVGHIWRLSNESITPPALTLVADIKESPVAFNAAPDGSTVIVTYAKIVRLKAPGTVETVTTADFGLLYPNSIVEMPNGTIYVGMRLFLVRLVPTSKAYQIEWLLPTDCPQFKRGGSGCVCVTT